MQIICHFYAQRNYIYTPLEVNGVAILAKFWSAVFLP